jgi:hypothetical protein
MISAPCENVPSPCENGIKYPDSSDCRYYYLCTNGILGDRQQCTVGADSCIYAGVACAFDIYTQRCIEPDGSFDCDYRCITSTAPLISTVQQTSTPQSYLTTDKQTTIMNPHKTAITPAVIEKTYTPITVITEDYTNSDILITTNEIFTIRDTDSYSTVTEISTLSETDADTAITKMYTLIDTDSDTTRQEKLTTSIVKDSTVHEEHSTNSM